MKPEEIHRYFINVLENRVPERTKLVEILMDTLFMEKRAIYRRLNGEVPFSFTDVVRIAEKLNISLHSFIYTGHVRKDRFELAFVEYTDMSEEDYKLWENYISLIDSAKNDPESEFAESSNMLPISIYGQYKSISKYYLFKYQYLLHGLEKKVSFGDLEVSERYYKNDKSYFDASKKIATNTYIWDYMLFQYLATDIRYFVDINLISAHDVELIKKDLLSLLDYIEQIALTGRFAETGNSATFYISDLNFDSNYSYLRTNNLCVSLVRTFILNSVNSTSNNSYIRIKDWIHSLKKSSTLITQSGAEYRADFLKKQREIILEL